MNSGQNEEFNMLNLVVCKVTTWFYRVHDVMCKHIFFFLHLKLYSQNNSTAYCEVNCLPYSTQSMKDAT